MRVGQLQEVEIGLRVQQAFSVEQAAVLAGNLLRQDRGSQDVVDVIEAEEGR